MAVAADPPDAHLAPGGSGMTLSKSVDLLAASMSARSRAQEIFANNLANVNTDGYLRQRVAFATELADAQQRLSVISRTDRAPGAAMPTGRLTDVAMQDECFLVVDTPAGERYMRGGSLRLNTDGELGDQQGNPVLGDAGPIMLSSGDFELTRGGEVLVGGTVAGRLRVVRFGPDAVIRPQGSGHYAIDQEPEEVENPQLAPGHRPTSNVDIVGEMVTMVESARLYETTARALRSYDETMGRLIQSTQQAIR
jgi:flagellar basal body rod protein FlgG